jgi:protein-L-isoaspartate(D-aspartate) O-methyltransferase
MADEEMAEQLRSRGITDARVLEAIASLNRADFIPPQAAAEANADIPIAIGYGQTISQPYIVAFMTQELRLKGTERVLEIGTGSGYQTAVLARLCAEVYSVEIIPELAEMARKRLTALGLTNVHLRQGDGHRGWPDAAPFDAVLLTAAPERIPDALVAQLRPGGCLIGPVGELSEAQELIRVQKREDGTLLLENLLPVRFVPMTRPEAVFLN